MCNEWLFSFSAPFLEYSNVQNPKAKCWQEVDVCRGQEEEGALVGLWQRTSISTPPWLPHQLQTKLQNIFFCLASPSSSLQKFFPRSYIFGVSSLGEPPHSASDDVFSYWKRQIFCLESAVNRTFSHLHSLMLTTTLPKTQSVFLTTIRIHKSRYVRFPKSLLHA